MGKAFILEAVRTPRGRGKAGKGALSGLHPHDLIAQAMNGLVKKAGVEPGVIEDVVLGAVSQVNEQGANIARNAVLAAGWPIEVTGVSLNRFCGSGLQAVAMAAFGVASGFQQAVVAGGVESMSKLPIGADGAGTDGNNERLRQRVFQVPQGLSADLIATREGFTRAELDAFSLRSHQKAVAAMEQKRFSRSLVPVVDPATGTTVLAQDELPRPSTTLESLGGLPVSFAALAGMELPDGRTLGQVTLVPYPDTKELKHFHTAGNSSPLTDGAAAVLVGSESFAKAHGLRPRAVVKAIATAGSEPVIMLTGPAPASRKALAQAGMTVKDIDLWEINEAFATVPLETMRRLEVDPEKVNVNGGAIALGHPLGATGAMLLGTVVDELERRNLATGLVTLCIGGGQAIAVIVERV